MNIKIKSKINLLQSIQKSKNKMMNCIIEIDKLKLHTYSNQNKWYTIHENYLYGSICFFIWILYFQTAKKHIKSKQNKNEINIYTYRIRVRKNENCIVIIDNELRIVFIYYLCFLLFCVLCVCVVFCFLFFVIFFFDKKQSVGFVHTQITIPVCSIYTSWYILYIHKLPFGK